MRKTIKSTLITIVDNGQQAVDVCLTQTFDVIFMDMVFVIW